MQTMVSSVCAVWGEGSGEQHWYFGDPGALAPTDNGYRAKGLRISAIDRDYTQLGNMGDINFTHTDQMIAVWRPGGGEERWATGETSDAFKALDDGHFAHGLRLVAVDTSNGAVTAVWRPGSGAQHWESGLTFDQFKARDAHHRDAGLRLSALDIDDGGKIFGVWRPGTGAERWEYGPYEQIKENNEAYMKQGLRLQALDFCNGNESYLGLWRPGSGASYWYTGMTVDEFKQRDGEFFSKGLRLVSVDLDRTEITTASPTTPAPSTTTRSLSLAQNGPYEGAGGNSTWMYYSLDVTSSDPASARKVVSVHNGSGHQIILAHGASSTNLAANATTTYFNGETFIGAWSAELLGVDGPHAPPFVQITITLQ